MELIDGKKIAASIFSVLAERVKKLPTAPLFCDIVVGDDPVQLSYVGLKGKAATRLGIEFLLEQMPVTSTTEQVVARIKQIAAMPRMSGLIVQLPLPPHVDRRAVLDAVPAQIDADVLSADAQKNFYSGMPEPLLPTARAVWSMLVERLAPGSTVAVVGQGELVGRPVSFLLESSGYVVTRIDRSSGDLKDAIAGSDAVVSAAGHPGLITGDMVPEGCIVIDAGTSELDGGIVGDVDTASVSQKASVLAPVPGGVGPVTVAMLMQNVVRSAEKLQSVI